jgi:hypothetical protein
MQSKLCLRSIASNEIIINRHERERKQSLLCLRSIASNEI